MMHDDDELSFRLDGAPGPAPRISPARADAMVASALQEFPSSASRSRRRRTRLFVLLAAAVLVAGAAAAAAYRMESRHAPPAVQPAISVAAPVSSTDTLPVYEAPQPVPSATSVTPSAQPVHAAQADLPPADLLRVANDLRAHKRWQAAAQTYESVISRSPRSDEAYTAMVAAASLELEQLGDPKGALGLYRRALEERPQGLLSEEARWGVAESYRALGNGAAEASALRDFLTAHPDSALAPKARARLATL